MLENRRPLHTAFCRSNRPRKLALQVKWVMPWELCLVHRKSTRNAFRSQLGTFEHKELP